MDSLRQTIRNMTTNKGVTHFARPNINDQKYLGRWHLEQNYTVINQKIDYANEDHCGVCSNGVHIKDNSHEERYTEEYIKYMM